MLASRLFIKRKFVCLQVNSLDGENKKLISNVSISHFTAVKLILSFYVADVDIKRGEGFSPENLKI